MVNLLNLPLPFCPFALLPFCLFALLHFCPFALLHFCPFANLPFCPYFTQCFALKFCPCTCNLPCGSSNVYGKGKGKIWGQTIVWNKGKRAKIRAKPQTNRMPIFLCKVLPYILVYLDCHFIILFFVRYYLTYKVLPYMDFYIGSHFIMILSCKVMFL